MNREQLKKQIVKNFEDSEITEKERLINVMQCIDAYIEQLPLHDVSVINKLKVLCKDINVDPENVLLEYCSVENGFDVLYDEGIAEPLVNKGFINA